MIESGGTLRISPVRKEDQGRYQCRATNLAAVRETRTARLRVLGKCQRTGALFVTCKTLKNTIV